MVRIHLTDIVLLNLPVNCLPPVGTPTSVSLAQEGIKASIA